MFFVNKVHQINTESYIRSWSPHIISSIVDQPCPWIKAPYRECEWVCVWVWVSVCACEWVWVWVSVSVSVSVSDGRVPQSVRYQWQDWYSFLHPWPHRSGETCSLRWECPPPPRSRRLLKWNTRMADLSRYRNQSHQQVPKKYFCFEEINII